MERCWPLFLSLLCVGVAAQSSSRAPAPSSPLGRLSIRGTVIDSQTGKPLDAVHVMLTLDESEGEPSIVYGAMSNAQGRFSIPDIPQGKYSVLPEKRGFIFVPDKKKNRVTFRGSLSLHVSASEHLDDLILPMVARAIVAGRVLDEHGDPMINASVTVLSVIGESGASVQTNGRGEFRVSVPPGKYYVLGSKYSDADWTENPMGSRTESGYARTYYPGATGMGRASVVEAVAGRVLTGVEFRLIRPVAYRVSGEITGLADGEQWFSVFWELVEWEEIGREEGRDSGRLDFHTQPGPATAAASTIKFDSPPLGAGIYYFYAVCDGCPEQLQSQIAEVTLSDSDATGVTLALVPGARITGTITVRGGPVVPSGEKLSVRLESKGPAHGGRLEGVMDADGSFTLSDVFPNRYRVEVGPLLDDAYIQSIDLNGSAVPGGLLDFFGGAEGAELKIVVSADGARLTGLVENPKAGGKATEVRVLLIPERDSPNLGEEDCKTATANSSGEYTFVGLAPGRYRLIARMSYQRHECVQAAAAIRRGLIAAESVDLTPGQRVVKNVQVAYEVRDEAHP